MRAWFAQSTVRAQLDMGETTMLSYGLDNPERNGLSHPHTNLTLSQDIRMNGDVSPDHLYDIFLNNI